MPVVPTPPPIKVRPRSFTTSFAPALIVIPAPAPPVVIAPSTPMQLTVIARSIVNGPYPAEVSTTISPPALVWRMAATKVRHGAVRLHGLLSLPWPDTNVRLDNAAAGVV